MNRDGPEQGEEGRYAVSPAQVTLRGWWQIAKRIFDRMAEDHISVVAAGVAFFFFLALIPALAALVSIYGLIMDPAQVVEQVSQFMTILPAEIRDTIEGILKRVAEESGSALSLSLATSLAISLWSAKKGMAGVFEGVNIAYHEVDRRGIIKKNALHLLFTLGALLMLCVSIALIVILPAIIEFLYLPGVVATVANWLRWPLLAIVAGFALALIYWKAPERSTPKPRWVSAGAVVAILLWLLGSWLFSLYVTNFGNFDRIYGSFAAIIILMFWLFLTAFIVLLGAEINAQSEYQTEMDTTVGEHKPMGERGAFYADHVAADDKGEPLPPTEKK